MVQTMLSGEVVTMREYWRRRAEGTEPRPTADNEFEAHMQRHAAEYANLSPEELAAVRKREYTEYNNAVNAGRAFAHEIMRIGPKAMLRILQGLDSPNGGNADGSSGM